MKCVFSKNVAFSDKINEIWNGPNSFFVHTIYKIKQVCKCFYLSNSNYSNLESKKGWAS